MPVKRPALGRGLSALIPTAPTAPTGPEAPPPPLETARPGGALEVDLDLLVEGHAPPASRRPKRIELSSHITVSPA